MKDKKSDEIVKVTMVLTEEQRDWFKEEARQKHAGNMSHLFRSILDKRYKMKSHVTRRGRNND